MAQAAGGTGAAHPPTIQVANNVGALEQALADARAAELAEEPARRIAAHRAKVAKAKAFLASAEQALADELAAQKGTD